MKNRNRFISLLTASLLLAAGVPFSGAFAQTESLDGKDTVFVSSFGKVRFGDKTYSAVKTFDEAAKELSEKGGRIVLQGTASTDSYPDKAFPLTVEGAGELATGNVLQLSQAEILLPSDTVFSRIVLKMPENGVIHTGGHDFCVKDGFDSFSTVQYIENGPNVKNYPAPLSVIAEPNGTVTLASGTYRSLSCGAGVGAITYRLSDISADTLTLGCELTGSVDAELRGAAIGLLTLGNDKIGGDVVVNLDAKTKIEKFDRADASLTGKVYAVADTDTEMPDGFFDIVLTLTEGRAETVFSEDGAFSGFRLYDRNGFAATSALSGAETISFENGVFKPEKSLTLTPCEAIRISPRRDGAYIAGYSDGTFRPQNKITRAEAVTTLCRLIADENEIKTLGAKSDFSDVSADAWFSPYIGLFARLGYLDTLKNENEILPNREITRGEFCELIMNVYPKFERKLLFPLSFPDVVKDYPYKNAVETAAFAGIVSGYEDGTFRPDALITRAEAVTMLNRLLCRIPSKNEETAVGGFSDIGTHWAKAQICVAANLSEKEGTIMWTTEKSSRFDGYMQYRASLNNTYYKLSHEKKLNVAFIGGSVTAGAGASIPDKTSWRARIVEDFQNAYPDCDIHQVNAAIGDSYTKYAVYRMDADLLAYDYDLVFVEYAINDSPWYSAENDNDTIVFFETLIRRIYEHNPKADIVIVYTIDDKIDRKLPYFPTAAAQEKIAKLYDIPSVNFGRALADYIGDGNLKWADYYSDYVHPNDTGYLYYASVLSEYLANALSDAESAAPAALCDKALPEKSAEKLWYNLTMLEAKDIDLSESKNWALSEDGKYIVPTAADNELILHTKGTDLCIAAPRADIMEYSVDGGDVQTMNMNRKPQTLAKNMTEGEHTLRIHAPDHTKLRIQRLMYNG